MLRFVIKNKELPERSSLTVRFDISTLRDVSWRTAQSTGAVAYMPYSSAQDYSDIYGTQEELYASEQQAARDAIISLAPFIDTSQADPPDPTPEEALQIEQQIQILQGQLLLVDSLMSSLDQQYKTYLAAHAPSG